MASVVIDNNSSESLQDEKKIFVGRLKLSKDFNIINYFKKYEDNDKVQPKIIRKSHRYLIIQFSSIAAARNAISDLNGKTIEGLSTRNIKVEGFVRQQANQSDNNTNKRKKKNNNRNNKNNSSSSSSNDSTSSNNSSNRNSGSNSNTNRNRRKNRRKKKKRLKQANERLPVGSPPQTVATFLKENILKKFNLKLHFSKETNKFVEKLCSENNGGLNDESLVDFTKRPYVTIDNDNSMDLDQAMFIEPNKDDGFFVSYALADGYYYCKSNSKLFNEALLRGGSSFYMPTMCVPMLPRLLSEDKMSLNQDVIRRALIFDITLDDKANVLKTECSWGKIKSLWKGSYRRTQEYYDAIDQGKKHELLNQPYTETLDMLRVVGQLRRRLARDRNVVEYNREKCGVAYNEESKQLQFRVFKQYKTELYNEQISLLCNMEGAKLMAKLNDDEKKQGRNNVQPIFRTQKAPNQGQLDTLVKMIQQMVELYQLDKVFLWENSKDGVKLGKYLKNLHHRLDADNNYEKNDSGIELRKKERRALMAIDRQAMVTNVSAHFETTRSQHFSLKVDSYARFSSPMRELVGVYTHEQLYEGIHPPKKMKVDKLDIALRDKIIQTAEGAKKQQKRIGGTVHKYVMDQFFGKDVLIKRKQDRRRHKGCIIGIDCGNFRRSRRIYVRLYSPPLIVKVELADLEGIYNTKFETNGVLGRYGTCVEIHAKNNSNAKEVDNNLTLTVGQNVVVQVYDYIKNGGGGGRRKYDKYVFNVSPV